MLKKITVIACMVVFLALIGTTIALSGVIDISSCAGAGESSNISIPDLLTELKIGKYYLEGGTENEYIEVFDDGTLQIFGFDYLQLVIDLDPKYFAGLTESKYQEFVASEQDTVDFWNSRIYYKLSELSQVIALDDERFKEGQLGGKEGYCLLYSDENTIFFDDGYVYKFAE